MCHGTAGHPREAAPAKRGGDCSLHDSDGAWQPCVQIAISECNTDMQSVGGRKSVDEVD
jgi:hypothetical protein